MRRTKQESEATRQAILAAARRVFARCGVTRATLEHVAAEAGVTRGAIYWHFDNKTALFDAMRVQVSVPLVERTDYASLAIRRGDPLAAVERFLRQCWTRSRTTRRRARPSRSCCSSASTWTSSRPSSRRQIQGWQELEAKLRRLYARARRDRALRAGLTPASAALGTCVFVAGLVAGCGCWTRAARCCARGRGG